MVMLEKPRFADVDPTIQDRLIVGPRTQEEALRMENPLQEGEFVILKDEPNAVTWYCAEIRKILADRIEVKLSRIPNKAKGKALKRSDLSQDMVYEQRHWFANHDTPEHKSWKNEVFMVGKDTSRGCRQTCVNSRSRFV